MPDFVESDALDVIEEEARAVAQFFGIKRCELAAKMLAGRVATRLGGRNVYVGSTTGRMAKSQLHAKIREQYTGRNLAELAIEHEMSERQVRRIVDRKATPKK